MTGAAVWRLVVLVAGATATAGCWALVARPARGLAGWTRSNFRGRQVSLVGGVLAGTLVFVGAVEKAVAAGRWIDAGIADDVRRVALATAVVVLGAGAIGLYDDLRGDPHAKGLRGHLGALRRGRVTSGLLKVVVICAVAAAGSIVLGDGRLTVQQVVDAGVIAGCANLTNLLDLRPGRALKALTVVGLPVVFATGAGVGLVLAWTVGVAVAMLWPDLGERAMLGDGGANALGGALGVALAGAGGLATSVVVLAGLVALTALSEVVSFSALIDRSAPLRWVDRLGRA